MSTKLRVLLEYKGQIYFGARAMGLAQDFLQQHLNGVTRNVKSLIAQWKEMTKPGARMEKFGATLVVLRERRCLKLKNSQYLNLALGGKKKKQAARIQPNGIDPPITWNVPTPPPLPDRWMVQAGEAMEEAATRLRDTMAAARQQEGRTWGQARAEDGLLPDVPAQPAPTIRPRTLRPPPPPRNRAVRRAIQFNRPAPLRRPGE